MAKRFEIISFIIISAELAVNFIGVLCLNGNKRLFCSCGDESQ